MMYMLVYIPLIIPITWLLTRYGLRLSVFLGIAVTVAGAWLKCVSLELARPQDDVSFAAQSSFAILMVAQFVAATGQVFLLGVPAQLAATWFGQRELALATAIGVFGNQVRPYFVYAVTFQYTYHIRLMVVTYVVLRFRPSLKMVVSRLHESAKRAL